MPQRRLPLLLIATLLLAPAALLQAQPEDLLVATTVVPEPPEQPNTRGADRSAHETPAWSTERMPVASELLIVSSVAHGGTYQVEIRDEQGKTVQQLTRSLAKGHYLLPIAVDGLVAGRYVASIHSQHDHQVVRFRRD